MSKSLSKPQVSSFAQSELDKAEVQLDQFEKEIKEAQENRNICVNKPESQMQTKMSQNQIANSSDIYLKPTKTVGSKEKFNERFRDDYNYAKELVHFVAEHKEIIGEAIEAWTKPFPGMPAEYWIIPPGKPVWGPRYLAEQIKRKFYNRLTTDNRTIQNTGTGTFFGNVIVDTQIQRMDAHPVSKKKTIFMGSNSF